MPYMATSAVDPAFQFVEAIIAFSQVKVESNVLHLPHPYISLNCSVGRPFGFKQVSVSLSLQVSVRMVTQKPA